MYVVAVVHGADFMRWEAGTAVRAYVQWSVMTPTPTNGCYVHRWQSVVVGWAWLHAMVSCTQLVVMMHPLATRHPVVLTALNGTSLFIQCNKVNLNVIVQLIGQYACQYCLVFNHPGQLSLPSLQGR